MKKTKVIKSDKKQKFDLTKEIVILCSISFDNKKTFKKSKFHRCTWNKHTVETRTFEFFQLLNTRAPGHLGNLVFIDFSWRRLNILIV